MLKFYVEVDFCLTGIQNYFFCKTLSLIFSSGIYVRHHNKESLLGWLHKYIIIFNYHFFKDIKIVFINFSFQGTLQKLYLSQPVELHLLEILSSLTLPLFWSFSSIFYLLVFFYFINIISKPTAQCWII